MLSYGFLGLTHNGGCIDRCNLPIIKGEVSDIITSEHAAALRLIPNQVAARHREAFRLSRDALVRDALFSKDGFNIKPPIMTNTGAPSVNDEARVKLRSTKLKKSVEDFLAHYESWKKGSKLLNTYIKAFETSIQPDGRIHPRYAVVTTVTGRSSTQQPSFQNLPKRGFGSEYIRRLIVAPEGRQLIAVDESQSELRWLAQLSGDKTMTAVYQGGGDIHITTALALLGKDESQLTKDELKAARQAAKSINFGLIYGMKVPNYIRHAKLEYGLDLTEEEARRHRDIFFSTYTGVAPYHQQVVEFVREHGYVASPFGRRRRLPEVRDPDQYVRYRSERQALNHGIQAASSDTVLAALTAMLVDDVLDSVEIKPIMFIHDELVFECDEDKLDYYIPIILHYMEHPPLKEWFDFDMTVPLKAEAKVGANFGSLSEYNIPS